MNNLLTFPSCRHQPTCVGVTVRVYRPGRFSFENTVFFGRFESEGAARRWATRFNSAARSVCDEFVFWQWELKSIRLVTPSEAGFEVAPVDPESALNDARRVAYLALGDMNFYYGSASHLLQGGCLPLKECT